MATDYRSSKRKAVGLFAVATDRFLSSWGVAPGRSFVAYPIDDLTQEQRDKLIRWMKSRGDYQRVRINMHLPRCGKGDHVAIYDAPTHVIVRKET